MSSSHKDGRIYVGNLPRSFQRKDVEAIFERFGKIVFVKGLNNRHEERKSTRPPFAFVDFEDYRDAEDAVAEMDGYNFHGVKIRVEFPRNFSTNRRTGSREGKGRGSDRSDPYRRSKYRVIVTGISATGSWQDLKDHMRKTGDVCFTEVYKDGSGVVEFRRYEDMKYAVKNLDHTKCRSHKGDHFVIRVKEEYSTGRRRSRSRDRSRNRSRSR